MSESDDMKTIVSLLGNMLEKLETVERRMDEIEGRINNRSAMTVEMIGNLAKSQDEFRSSMNNTGENFNKWVNTVEDRNAKHHYEMDAWTKDVSTKLVQLGMQIDQKKLKLF